MKSTIFLAMYAKKIVLNNSIDYIFIYLKPKKLLAC